MDGMIAMDSWTDLCGLDDIPARGSRRVMIAGTEVALFRTASDQVYAIDNKCPHLQGPLSEGIVHGAAVTCPLHSLVIDLATGQGKEEDSGCVATYPVELRGGRVFLKAAG